ncbi:MAG: tetratricopeptide repeat protein [Clostridiales bacterium]|nr:tetratricopeptide repeat protein [Clostridiales bacterium]
MRLKRLFVSLAVVLTASGFLFGQGYRGQGRISGVVTDQDGNPLAGVKVKLFSLKGQSGFETETDKNGEWKALYVRGGTWNIDFEKPGYIPRKISAEVKEFDRNKPIDIKMEKICGLIITEELKAALKQGNDLYEAGKYEEAVTAYEAIIQVNPDAYIIFMNIGNCYFQMEKYAQAEEYYRKVLEKDPENAEAILLIGNTYANRGQDAKAMDWYNRIDFEKITDETVLFNLGSNFFKQSKLDQALKYLQRAVEIKPDFADAVYQLGLTYLAMNNYSGALAAFENYLKLDSTSGRAEQVKGFIEFLKKK